MPFTGHRRDDIFSVPYDMGTEGRMETAEEEMIIDEAEPAEIEKELWPILKEEVREFEEYLMDLDLRF